MRKLLLVIIILVLGGWASLTAAPADRVTENCVIFVQADNVREAVRQVASYAAYAGQQVNGDLVLNMLSMQLFGRSGFPGIDIEKPAALYFYAFGNGPLFGGAGGQKKPPQIVISLPVSDRNTFNQVVRPRLMLMGLQVRQAGDRALLASSVRAMNEYLRGRRIRAMVLKGYQLSIYLNMEKFKSTIEKVMRKGFTKHRGMPAVFSSLVDVYMKILADTISGSYGLSLARDGVEGGLGLAFRPGSLMARMAAANSPDSLRILKVLPRESIAVFAGSSDPESSEKVLSHILDGFGSFPTLQGFLRPIVRYLGKNMTGKSAMAMLPEPGIGMSFAMVNGVRSESRSRSFLNDLADSINNLSIIRKLRRKGINLRFVYTKEVRTVADKQVDIFKLTMTTPQPVPESQRALYDMIMRLFTANIVYTGGYEIMVFGDSPDKWLRVLIRNADGGDGGFKSSQAWTRFNRRFGRYPKNGMFYFSLSGFLNEVKQIARSVAPGKAAMFNMFSLPGSVYGYTYTRGNQVRMRVLMEREAIAGLIRIFSLFNKKAPVKQPRRFD